MLYLNDQPINVTIFPDKTSQVWKLDSNLFQDSKLKRLAHVEWRFEHEGEFMHLAQLKCLLGEYGIEANLKLDYLPYGRQDKGANNHATFALYPFSDLLNSLNFNDIEIVDPHSEHALEWIANSHATYPVKQVEQTAQSLEGEVLFCYPDKGALTKYSKVYEKCYRPYIYGEKVRDQLTGNILNYKVVGDPAGKNVLIVDDICDFGRTFILLAKDLYAASAKEVNLFVSHGLFSGGIKVLTDAGIKRIFTKNGEVNYGG